MNRLRQEPALNPSMAPEMRRGSAEPLHHAPRQPDPERSAFELELELIQTHMTQKPTLRVEVGALGAHQVENIRGSWIDANVISPGWASH